MKRITGRMGYHSPGQIGGEHYRSIAVITCDGCGATASNEIDCISVARFEVILRNNGWIIGNYHHCPTCVRQAKQQKQADTHARKREHYIVMFQSGTDCVELSLDPDTIITMVVVDDWGKEISRAYAKVGLFGGITRT